MRKKITLIQCLTVEEALDKWEHGWTPCTYISSTNGFQAVLLDSANADWAEKRITALFECGYDIYAKTEEII